MGYTTTFEGGFDFDRPLNKDHAEYLKKFSETRRMKRDSKKTESRLDPTREAVGLPVGVEGEFFVGESGFYGQDNGPDVIDYNYPASTQPCLWCQWVPNEDRCSLIWNESEKFYNYIDWLVYMVEKFFEPWGYRLNGSVFWCGEDIGDTGLIEVTNNQIHVNRGCSYKEYKKHLIGGVDNGRKLYSQMYFKDQDPKYPLISGLPLPKDNDGVVRDKKFVNCEFHPNCQSTIYENCVFVNCVQDPLDEWIFSVTVKEEEQTRR